MGKNNCGEYCSSCNISVGKKRLREHKSETLHKENEKKQKGLSADRLKNPRVREEKLPIFEPPPSSTSFQHHVDKFISQVRYEPKECHEIRLKILEDLQTALAETFEKCWFSFFGSMTVGLAFISSDLDIYVDVDKFIYKREVLNEKHEDLSKVFLCANALYRDKNFTDIEPIFEAKVPIVKIVHVPTKVSCDISFSKMGVESSRLVQMYLKRNRRFLEVMLLIKYWAKRNGICSGQKSISSYSWTLLFISYLQTLRLPNGESLLPSLLEVQKKGKPEMINGCRVDCDLGNDTTLTLPDDPAFSHQGLLEGFFRYYKNFQFGQSIVSPFLGKPIQYAAISPKRGSTLDRESMAYARCFDAWKKASKGVEIIQDPFIHGNLMTCSRRKFTLVKSCLVRASQICEAEQSPSVLRCLFCTTTLGNLQSTGNDTNGNPVLVSKRTRSRKKNKTTAAATSRQRLRGTSVERILPQSIYNGEICMDGFFVPLGHISINGAVDAVENILSKLMMFNVSRDVAAQANGFEQRAGSIVQKLQCVPLCPVPWILLKKKGLDKLVPNLGTKTVMAFRSEYFRTLQMNFSCRPSEMRRFECEICKVSGPVMKITFKPSFKDSSGFSLHVTNFLRTSLEKWILVVFANM